MRRCFTPSVSGAQAAKTREEKVRALQDGRVPIETASYLSLFAADLVADYLAVSWADKLLPFSKLSLADLGASCWLLDFRIILQRAR
jgi:hypothetical protein